MKRHAKQLSPSWPGYLFGIAAMCALLSGCRGRAKDDLYIETMSAEIRDLEDQLYEYDYEYRRLENENASLQQQLSYVKGDNGDAPTSRPSILDDLTGRSGNRRRPAEGRTPARRPADLLPAPTGDDQFNDTGDFDLEGVSPPTIEMGSEGAPPISLLGSPDSQVQFDSDNGGSPSYGTPLTGTPAGPLTGGNGSGSSPSLGNGNLASGNLSRDNLASDNGSGLSASAPGEIPDNEMELSLAQIQVPALMASQGGSPKASLTPAVQQVTDKRVVEMVFHPTISRAIDLDGEDGDDGVYIVLQPKNTHGQMVPDPGQLEIAILDPSLPKGQDRIGRWSYSPDDVRSKMEPIGAQQGIHLRLPWNGRSPRADRVLVFARYTFRDGRKVVGYKEIFLWSDTQSKTVWTPRASSGTLTEPRGTGMMQAHDASSSIEFESVDRAVVRPASGTRTNDPAPAPVRTAGGFLD